jgi:hypothetical protein
VAQIDDVTAAIHTAREATEALMGLIAIDITEMGGRVHVRAPRDLEQVPGEVKLRPHGDGLEHTQTYKDYGGVRFFCLTRVE